MISVIVPIYKAEQYLEKCLDSILAQTYRELDVILVDDGSPDRSGQICDLYAEKDNRFRVFHTLNQGVSEARNLGIDKALEKNSEYIAFVDSDDWLEPAMYEKLVEIAEKTECDAVVCGYFEEKDGEESIWSRPEKRMDHTEAIKELMQGGIVNVPWNKLWRTKCFSAIRFPQGQIFEDVLTIYRVLDQIHELIRIPDLLYHYTVRSGSLCHTYDLPTVIAKWKAYWKQYDELSRDARFTDDKELLKYLEPRLKEAIFSIWSHENPMHHEQRRLYAAELREMNAFAKKHFPPLGCKEDSSIGRVLAFFARFPYAISLPITGICRYPRLVYRQIRNKLGSRR